MNITFCSIFKYEYPRNYNLNNCTVHTSELMFFTEGRGFLNINGNSYKYEPKSICYIHPDDIIDFEVAKKTICISLRFTGILDINDLESGIYNFDDPLFFQLFSKILHENKAKENFYLEISSGLIAQILLLMTRKNKIRDEDLDIYEQISKIDNDFSSKISIKKIAEATPYSYDHFRHKFKAVIGISPSNYIIQKRIEHACYLILKYSYSCAKVAKMCGYSSSAQFSSQFKDRTGISPLHYNKFVSREIFPPEKEKIDT